MAYFEYVSFVQYLFPLYICLYRWD